MRPFLDGGLRFGEKKKRTSCEFRSMPGKNKTLRLKKPLNWKQTIVFSTRKVLNPIRVGLCAM